LSHVQKIIFCYLIKKEKKGTKFENFNEYILTIVNIIYMSLLVKRGFLVIINNNMTYFENRLINKMKIQK
jgi:hypothetical protein